MMAGRTAGQFFRAMLHALKPRREQERKARRKRYSMKYPAYMKGGPQPKISPEAPSVVYLPKNEKAGSVIIDTGGRKLYYVLGKGKAYQYPISVGRRGYTWTGTKRISRIASWPSWTPPAEMRQRQPGLPITVSGGVRNPLGAKALYLGSSLYRIHGTNNPRSIGRASSSGCFRMMNKHVVHLAKMVRVGTKVRVLAKYGQVTDASMASLWPFLILSARLKNSAHRIQ